MKRKFFKFYYHQACFYDFSEGKPKQVKNPLKAQRVGYFENKKDFFSFLKFWSRENYNYYQTRLDLQRNSCSQILEGEKTNYLNSDLSLNLWIQQPIYIKAL